MTNPIITVFTPTYNRVDLLPRLHESLKLQKFINFEWLIVDDGSTDDTEAVVKNFMAEEQIKIRYYYKNNGGKHTAVNLGVQMALGNLFFIVDSDDWLTENSLRTIRLQWAEIEKKVDICGIIGLSAFNNGRVVGDLFPWDSWEVSFVDVYLKHRIKGDKAVAFKTEILKQFPFPEKENIRFVFEAVVWHEMAKKYRVLAVNEVLQNKEYLSEGLTGSSYQKWYVISLAYSYFTLIKNRTYPPSKYPNAFIWNFIHLGINSMLSKNTYFMQLRFCEKLIYLIVFPRAYYSFIRMKILLKDDQ